MKRVTKRVTVIGGAATGTATLENIADTAILLGIADDAAAFTAWDALKNPLQVRRAICEGSTITHSYGIVAVASHKDIVVPDVLACNGPEQRIGEGGAKKLGQAALGLSAARKMLNNRRNARDPNNEFGVEYRQINRANKLEVLRRPIVHWGILKEVQSFSTSDYLRESLAADEEGNAQRAAAVSATDEFFPHLSERDYGGTRLIVYEGGHDAFLANPRPILAEWAKPIE